MAEKHSGQRPKPQNARRPRAGGEALRSICGALPAALIRQAAAGTVRRTDTSRSSGPHRDSHETGRRAAQPPNTTRFPTRQAQSLGNHGGGETAARHTSGAGTYDNRRRTRHDNVGRTDRANEDGAGGREKMEAPPSRASLGNNPIGPTTLCLPQPLHRCAGRTSHKTSHEASNVASRLHERPKSVSAPVVRHRAFMPPLVRTANSTRSQPASIRRPSKGCSVCFARRRSP